ncbi:sensor histidine kinase [Clostridium massiliodielmoense]|uniref:sensor histidine kinase n=1 Tax=Clostridium massiliodielmoense TaxID=1776385 RepID=UPI0001666840|nr:HAMP domain-containing sensor histidine kinase [Clostridium massiliodielmoense]EDS76791.1 alkaline phosphatase synthesis sensor protein PhoR [Clostridium botulinum C str. Eklund]KEH98262.1 membrane protein [Clostridium botulinum C/D str. BKT12695]NEZ49339.1 HAMP domain-containing histidine kinase [Clostridium botulinum]
MKSIRNKVTLSYIGIIIFTVVISQIIVLTSIKKYFYDNAKELLKNQITLSAEFYNTYLSSIDLKQNVANDVDIFWKNTSAEVQILDTKGNVLMDSMGYSPNDITTSKDFNQALLGHLGLYIHKATDSTENIMSISTPLKKGDTIQGVLRFVSSLNKIDNHIRSIAFYFMIVAIIVIIISSVISLVISRKITHPLREITEGAELFASGKFKQKIAKSSYDEFGKLADTLNYMAQEILKNEKLKTEFIASISHELRTPLTSIKGWTVALSLCDPNNKSEFEDGLTIIEEETDRLSNLVEELLDFSKLSSGKITLKKDYVDIHELLIYLQKQLQPRASKDNIHLSLECKNEIPNIYADINRLKQSFMNILDNALKFTASDGKVKITLSSNKDSVIINIKDNGCGIPLDDLPRVTEKFYKGQNSKSKNGIGLSICSEIISLHNGNLQILSEENKGTEVIVCLPLANL